MEEAFQAGKGLHGRDIDIRHAPAPATTDDKPPLGNHEDQALRFGELEFSRPGRYPSLGTMPMATFVLVHPAWFGGWSWNKLAPLLRAARHAVYAPTLTGLGERAHLASPGIGLGTHVDDVVNVLTFEDLDDVILVGNSSAGVVISAVADRVPERIAQVVYLVGDRAIESGLGLLRAGDAAPAVHHPSPRAERGPARRRRLTAPR